MIANALVIGFFTAVGWFSAQRMMAIVFVPNSETLQVQKEK
jgi:hypothetical protein